MALFDPPAGLEEDDGSGDDAWKWDVEAYRVAGAANIAEVLMILRLANTRRD